MAQQTAVEWLYEQMSDKQPNWLYVIDTKEYVQKLWEQAKEMEKEQIIKAVDSNFSYDNNGYPTLGEQYYNETYNK